MDTLIILYCLGTMIEQILYKFGTDTIPPDYLQITEATEMKVMGTRSYHIKEILCLYLMRHEVLLHCSDWLQISKLK